MGVHVIVVSASSVIFKIKYMIIMCKLSSDHVMR